MHPVFYTSADWPSIIGSREDLSDLHLQAKVHKDFPPVDLSP